MQRKNLQHTHQ